MKKFILSLLISLISLLSIAGNGNADKIYHYLENKHGAFSMSLSKDMTDFFDMDIDFNGKEKWITGDFSKGKMVMVGHHISMKEITKMFEDEGFEKIEFEDQDESEADNVALLISRRGKNVAEAHFVVEEDDSLILLSVYGDMKVRDK